MAERRMFAKTIIDSDEFLDMPQSSQLLYFHLSMRADDEGFINNPKSIMRNCKCSEDDLKVLSGKKFIIPFESGIVVIKHWKIHNYIAKDRFNETKYHEEKSQLELDENKAYRQMYTECIQDVYEMDTQVRLGKVRLGKDSIDKNIYPEEEKPKSEKDKKPKKHKYGEYNHVLLTDEEYDKLMNEYPNHKEIIKYLDEAIEMKGYKYKSHYLAIKKWVVDAVKRPVNHGNQKNNNFNNINQRDYNYSELEKKLLGG